jgi:hypothetical protein
VNLMTSFDSSYKFVQLHRSFHELLKHSSDNDDVDVSQTFPIGDCLCWSDLIKEYRVIILSNAGSGKTAEIRNITCTLRKQKKSAFFLRLEHIPSNFEDAFEIGSYETFKEWLASGEEGWLLLDSVDEARLQSPSDFELAIRMLSRQISIAKDRTHIVITSRTTAWRPKTDLAYCTTHLPYAVAATSERDPQVEDDSPEGSLRTKTEMKDRTKPVFKIVALDDLTSKQVFRVC